MPPSLAALPGWLFGAGPVGARGRLAARWLFLRALGFIFFSAFCSLAFQARGLIAPDGLLPAGEYLQAVQRYYPGLARFWFAPTLLWFGSGSRAIVLLTWIGLVASVLLVLNIWPRGTIAVCMVVFLSFIAALQAFSSYQSDGMLLSAGFISLFIAPPGWLPSWGEHHSPPRAAWLLLLLEWFTIYFESGVAKIAGGDPEWRHLTAMDDYYQNGPLPTWIAWYAHHLPHWFHVGSAGLTLALELVLVWMAILPRRFRLILFCIVTPWQLGIILTGNYAFLNYIVLVLGIFLLDDGYLAKLLPSRLQPGVTNAAGDPPSNSEGQMSKSVRDLAQDGENTPHEAITKADASQPQPSSPIMAKVDLRAVRGEVRGSHPGTAGINRGGNLIGGSAKTSVLRVANAVSAVISSLLLTWVFYAITAQMALMVLPRVPFPLQPVAALDPFRIANQFGLFAVMTRGRYEIEFQGSNDDGITWIAYPFRYKPQDLRQAPGIYAPYQPRFEWNLWFASLDNWRQNRFVLNCEERLLTGSPDVLALFARNPFPQTPPRQIRSVIWQYWFTDRQEKRQGFWWRRQMIGLYAPQMELGPDGKFVITAMPEPGQAVRQ